MRTRLFPTAITALTLVSTSLVGATAGAQTDSSTGADAPAPPEVEVLDRGDAPRVDLRFTVPAGANETVSMRSYAHITQTINGTTATGRVPNITVEIDLTVDDVDTAGNLSMSYEYASIEVTPNGNDEVVEATREALDPLTGVTGTMVMTDKGALVSSSIDIPPDVPPETAQFVEQFESQSASLTTPLPDGKVGAGARWRATSTSELQGIRFTQVTTYTVEEIRNGRVTLTTKVRQTADRQEFTPTGTDEQVELLSSRGKGTGDVVIDPTDSVFPLNGVSDIEVRQRIRTDEDEITQRTRASVFIND